MRRGSYTETIPARFLYFFTPVTVILSIVFLGGLVSRRLHSPPGSKPVLLFLYLIGLTHIFLFREGALHHEYWLYYFSVPLVITSAVGLEFLLSGINKPWVKGFLLVLVFGIFIPMSVLRVQAVHRIKKFEHIPDLGLWLRENTAATEEILIIGPSLAHFGQSEKHFDYYIGPIYTWPMPHIGYYSQRKLRWGIRDMEELEVILSNPGNLRYAAITMEYTDSLVNAAHEFLRLNRKEIKPEVWGKGNSVSVRIFDMRQNESKQL
jgi:hypothetical protein